jgi:hypothetical protein
MSMLQPKQEQIIRDFVHFSIKDMGIETPVKIKLLSKRDGLETTAAYVPSESLVKVYVAGRAVVDICRSIAHELKHHRQKETGELEAMAKEKGEIPDIGDRIEDDANATAGQLIKKFAKTQSKLIYEQVDVSKKQFEALKKYIFKQTFDNFHVQIFDDEYTFSFQIKDAHLQRTKIGHDKYVNVIVFYYELLNGQPPNDLRWFMLEGAHILSYFSIKVDTIFALPFGKKDVGFSDTEIIYEQEEKRIPIDTFIKKVTNLWKKKQKISPYDLVYMSVQEMYGHDLYDEFVVKMMEATMEIIRDDDKTIFEHSIPFGSIENCFECVDCDYDVYYTFEDVLKSTAKTIETPEWSEYVFNYIDQSNIDLLSKYTKVNHITFEYLDMEFPDLCHMFCFDFARATFEKSYSSAKLYIMDSLKKMFDGCQIAYSKKSKELMIKMPIQFLLKSSLVVRQIKAILIEYYQSILDGKVDKQINSTSDILNIAFQDFGEMTFSPMPKIFQQWNGGELPIFNCKEGIESGVDTNHFNQLVGETIMKFFDQHF